MKTTFTVESAGSVPMSTTISNLIIAKEIATSAKEGRPKITQILRVRIHDVTLQALLAFVLRAVIIRYQQWVRGKGVDAAERFMRDNPKYLHDISASLSNGRDFVEELKSAKDPVAELQALVDKAGLGSKFKITAAE